MKLLLIRNRHNRQNRTQYNIVLLGALYNNNAYVLVPRF